MFLLQFTEKHLGHDDSSVRIEPYAKGYIRIWINRGKEPESLPIDLDNCLVESDFLRLPTTTRLEVCLLNPVVN